MVIGPRFSRENHSLFPATAIGRWLELLDVITDPRTGLNINQKKKNWHDRIRNGVPPIIEKKRRWKIDSGGLDM